MSAQRVSGKTAVSPHLPQSEATVALVQATVTAIGCKEWDAGAGGTREGERYFANGRFPLIHNWSEVVHIVLKPVNSYK